MFLATLRLGPRASAVTSPTLSALSVRVASIASLSRQSPHCHITNQTVSAVHLHTNAVSLAGHSHWANIKHKKAASDAKKAQAFNKICKAILAEAKMNADPTANLRLASLISRARNNNVPKDKIEATLQRATSDDTSNSEHIVYEGMGPGGVAVLVSTLTDNRNRTHAQLRTIFNRAGGNLGSSGAVMWMFDRCGVLLFDGKFGEEKVSFHLSSFLILSIDEYQPFSDITFILI
eukprot:TRINITY_DN7940_c0_g1_i1.p1 TRINITY_DN7940_c0_g1~~TRINITY_DN7940_c0_g1_i1.p1  ORF type:complete len:234 (+),score=49.49 TRINITY_DN7940_c0_g1_i1:71-772(+)